MVWIGWEARLDAARNDAEVIGVAQDFLASLDPVELTHLPPSCAARKLATANDVQAYAFDLLRECQGADERLAILLLRMSNFFARASHRLASLNAPGRTISDRTLGLPRSKRENP